MVSQQHVAVVGAGILGLTSALVLRDHGYRVTILARDLPGDTYSQAFSSPWAGADFSPFAKEDDLEGQRWERETYAKLKSLVPQLGPEILHMAPYDTIGRRSGDVTGDVWYKDAVDDFRVLRSSSGAAIGVFFRTILINVPAYTRWIVSQLLTDLPDRPAVSIRRVLSLSHLSQALAHVPNASVIINATGLGAASLASDPAVYPIKGQTVLVRSARMAASPRCLTRTASLSYVIPRAKSGTVILGGSWEERCGDMKPDHGTTERILKAAVEAAPELLPEGVQPGPEAWKRLDVVSVNVGLRPAREGGARVEIDSQFIRGVPVVHAYGIGPGGYQNSWGIASRVLHLVQTAVPLIPPSLHL